MTANLRGYETSRSNYSNKLNKIEELACLSGSKKTPNFRNNSDCIAVVVGLLVTKTLTEMSFQQFITNCWLEMLSRI